MDQDKKFKVTIPFGGGIINGTIKWKLEVGAIFESDCGTICMPVSKDDWSKLLSLTTPTTPTATFSISTKI